MFNFFQKNIEPSYSHTHDVDGLMEKCYQELIVKHHIQSDAGQVKVLEHLQQLLDNITAQIDYEKQPAFNRLIATSKRTKSLYIFGEVGRGKSMLMDVFFEVCPIESKRRVHFHAFMQEIHDYMHQWRKHEQGDPLPSLAVNIRQSSLLLCFDEFHVSDITDATLLARLFTHLFQQGVVFVATSNQHPDELYKNGFRRELLLPFIELLKQSADVLELVAKEDYRLSHFKAMRTIYYCKSVGREAFLQDSFNELTNNGIKKPKTLKIKARELRFEAVHGDILFTSFNELCGRLLGPADFLVIAQEFTTILIADIPQLSVDIRDQIRRFVILIDALYEKNVKIICTADVPLKQLTIEDNGFDFKRTWSRLYEMQSEQYLQRKHLS